MNTSEFNEKLKNSCILDRANDKLEIDGWLPVSYVRDMVLKEFNILETPDLFEDIDY